MKVTCEISYIELDNEEGYPVDSVSAQCTRCDHETESFGQGENSIKRCLVLMRDECPKGERNFYVEVEE